MEFNLITNLESCRLMILTEDTALLFYSHIPTAAISLLLGIFVFVKNRKSLASRLFLLISILFVFWCSLDLILWRSADSRTTMFFWSLINLAENLVTAITLYFAYVFINKEDIALKFKIIFASLFLPYLFLIPTAYNITVFNGTLCEAEQGILVSYFYFLEVLFFLILLAYLLIKVIKAKKEERKQVLYFSAGAVLFLASFSGANIAGSLAAVINPENPDNWRILQYGLFGMPVFAGFLAYLIVRFKAFNIKFMAVQALVVALVVLVGSQFFFIQEFASQVLTGVTLALSLIFGFMLIHSVKIEVKRKDELQLMTGELAVANDRLRKLDNAKSEFISIVSHQLRTPLTAIKGFVSLLLEGSYGKISVKHKDVLDKVYISSERLINLVEDMLNISRIESGRMEYNYEKVDILDVCKEVTDTFVIRAKEKKLFLDLKTPDSPLPSTMTDRRRIVEVISNIIDNAIKYTDEGGITVSLLKDSSFVKVSVKDTGVGIPKKELPYLFTKFSRGKDITRLSATGTGLGLHVSRSMIEAMGGKVTVQSDGIKRGSVFTIHVPIEV